MKIHVALTVLRKMNSSFSKQGQEWKKERGQRSLEEREAIFVYFIMG